MLKNSASTNRHRQSYDIYLNANPGTPPVNLVLDLHGGLVIVIMTLMFIKFSIIFLSAIAYAVPQKVEIKNELKAPKAKLSTWANDPIGRNAEIQFPIDYHSSIDFWISSFTRFNDGSVRTWLNRAEKFLPYIRKEFKKAGLPQDLAYLVLIESGVSPFAVSPARAVGPWQFIHATGKRFGLKKKWWLDERRDFEKSTRAAIIYLRQLHRQFNDWHLVLAAYNMGENGLRRRIRRYKTRNFWRLRDRRVIPKETREYVPKFLAIMFIAKSPDLYGISAIHKAPALAWEKVAVPGGTELNRIADQLKVTRSHIKLLNAELIRGYVPRGIRLHYIKVPVGGKKILAKMNLFKSSFRLRVAQTKSLLLKNTVK